MEKLLTVTDKSALGLEVSVGHALGEPEWELLAKFAFAGCQIVSRLGLFARFPSTYSQGLKKDLCEALRRNGELTPSMERAFVRLSYLSTKSVRLTE